MQDAFKIFFKSISLLMNNLDAAVRISGTVFVITIFVTSVLNVMMTGQMMLPRGVPGEVIPTPILTAVLIGGLFTLVMFTWITVAWHRFVLLEETSLALLPKWSSERIIGYIGNTIKLSLVVVLMLLIPVGMLALLFSTLGSRELMAFIGPIAMIFAYYGMFRVGLVLPSFAIDKDISIQKSLEVSKPFSNTIWVLAIITIFTFGFISFLTSMLAPNNLIGVLMTAIVQWVSVLVSASLLTTLYGHLLEGRSLD